MVGQPQSWMALCAGVTLILLLGASALRVTVILTRLVDSVRDLNQSMKDVLVNIDNHENRLSHLEHPGEPLRPGP